MKNYIISSLKIMFAYLKVIIIAILPSSFILNPSIVNQKWAYIYSIAFVIASAMIIYSDAFRIARNDCKRYSLSKPYAIKGAFISLPLVFFIASLMFLQHMYYGSGVLGSYINLFYVAWIVAFYGFVPIGGAFLSFNVSVFILLLMVISSAIGYFAGMKNFYISEIISHLVYNKKDKDDPKRR